MSAGRLALLGRRLAALMMAGAIVGWVWNPQSWRSLEDPPGGGGPTLEFKSPTMTVAEARTAFEEGRLLAVDARQRPAYERGHIPGAIAAWTSGGESLFAEVRRWIPANDPELSVVVVGTGARGYDARRLAGRLRMTGAVAPRVLEGGMSAWLAAGLPVVRGWDMEPLLEQRR